MEGRDIGTVVFPARRREALPRRVARGARAPPRQRSRALGGRRAVAEVASALTARDEIDRTRAASPLYAAADAVLVDTTGKPVTAVVDEVMQVIRGRLK